MRRWTAIIVILSALAVVGMFGLPAIYVPPSPGCNYHSTGINPGGPLCMPSNYDSVSLYFAGVGGQFSSDHRLYSLCWPTSWPYPATDCQSWQIPNL